MSRGYVAVHWNRRKWIYDACLWAGIAAYLAAFIAVSNALHTGAAALSAPIVLMRALATCGFWMLTFILCIGPLARLDRRFLPLLYNRRHFGVSLFVIALLHAAVAVYWYHAFGATNPLVSVFTAGGALPFQALGAVALLLLFVLAATSHDYWNATLGGALWKAIHFGIYPAYALVIAHITFGALQQDNSGFMPGFALAGVALVGGLHLIAAFTRSAADRDIDGGGASPGAPWVAACHWRDIPNNRALTVSVGGGERIAVFRYDQTKLAAVSNVCQHQNGPLGEGRVIDGLLTCPWHGYQYRPEDGCSPPPFGEKVATYRLRLDGGQVWLDPTPLPPGTARAVTEIPDAVAAADTDDR